MITHWIYRLILTSMLLLSAPQAAQALTLEETLKAAYANNPRIKAERARLESTDESVAQAASGFRPTINGSFLRGRQNTSFNNGPAQHGDSENRSLRIEQPLFRGGATVASMHSAEQRVKSGQYDLSAVEQQTMLDAATAYMAVFTTHALLDLARQNETVLSQQLKAADARFKVGEVTKTDVAQANARLADAMAARITAEGQLQSAMAQYERVVGIPLVGAVTLPETMPELPHALPEALERARSANPQLLAALHAAKSSFYDVDRNEAALLPQVSLFGNVSQDKGVGATGNSAFDQNRVGVEVRIPLYQAGAEYSRIRAAKATARSLDHEAISTRQTVDELVTQGWVSLENAISTITARNAQISAASLALEGVKSEHQFGTRTLLDVLDSEQELFTARSNLVRAERDRVVAAYTLAFRLGQLTPTALGADFTAHDPKQHAADVAWQPIGY